MSGTVFTRANPLQGGLDYVRPPRIPELEDALARGAATKGQRPSVQSALLSSQEG
jgi:hypothetical protein